MTRTFLGLRRALLAAPAVIVFWAGVPASSQQQDWSGWDDCAVQLVLPEEEDFLEATSDLRDHILKQQSLSADDDWVGEPVGDGAKFRVMAECFLVKGPGTIEVTVALTAEHPEVEALVVGSLPPLLEFRLLGDAAGSSAEPLTHLDVGSQYRELMLDPDPEGRLIEAILNGERYRELMDRGLLHSGDLDRIYRYTKIVWSLRRLRRGPCLMQASVSGDVSGEHIGDVAFFNVFEEGVAQGAAAGTFLDPTAHEALEGLAEFAGWVDGLLGDEADEPEESASAAASEKSSLRRAFETEWDLSGTDNFGLNLVGVLFDAEEPSPTAGGGQSDLVGKLLAGDPVAAAGLAQGMDVLGSTFSLAVTGRLPGTGDQKPDEDDKGKQGDQVGTFFTVEPSSLMVLPGAMDANLGGVKFLWKPGEPGQVRVTFKYFSPGVIAGHLEGEAYTEKPYGDGRRLKVKVQAAFVALQSAISCQ